MNITGVKVRKGHTVISVNGEFVLLRCDNGEYRIPPADDAHCGDVAAQNLAYRSYVVGNVVQTLGLHCIFDALAPKAVRHG